MGGDDTYLEVLNRPGVNSTSHSTANAARILSLIGIGWMILSMLGMGLQVLGIIAAIASDM